MKIFVFLIALFSSTVCLAQEFNNLPLTEKELNLAVERSYSMGTTQGFSGIRPYSRVELLNVYHETKDPYIYKYIQKDLMEIGLSPDGKTAASDFYIEPLSEITFRAYTFNTDVPNKERYCLENMEGNCLDEGLTTFLNLTGQGRIFKNMTFFYEGQLENSKEETRALLKKAYIKLKTGVISWEFGKDSLWLGHGYRGSLLLSDNAEPFLLFKVQVERPFNLPIQYTFFHGWLDDFNILGHRLAWKPFSILELGANQTAVYSKDKGFKVWDWPHVLFSSEENAPAAKFNTDQRASLDAALYTPFLNKIPYLGLKGGKIYAEYGGEDMYAWWQKEDKVWHGPLGFEFLGQGILLGLFLTTGNTDFRYEYTENYIDHPILYDLYDKYGLPYAQKTNSWYRNIPFLYKGAMMGHVMGPEAEDNFFELKQRFSNLTFTVFYDRQRHHIYNKISGYDVPKTIPEKKQQFGLDVLYSWKKFEIDGTVIYNRYTNVNSNPNVLEPGHGYNILVGVGAKELITGIAIKYIW